MKKIALVFSLAVLAPSLILAWLAARSVRDQQFLLERQQSLIYQGVADALAKDTAGLLAERQREFGLQVEALLASRKEEVLLATFDDELRRAWSLAEVGFVVQLDGKVLAPSVFGRPLARQFRLENDAFLCNRESVEVYWNSPKGGNQVMPPSANIKANSSSYTSAETNLKQEQQVAANGDAWNSYNGQARRNVMPQQQQLVPQNDRDDGQASKLAPAEAEFRQLIGTANEGTVARFLQNKLKLMFWYRRPGDPQTVFGAQIDLARLLETLTPAIKLERPFAEEICVALLDDTAKPVAQTHAGFSAPWRRPFVATEIGEALPHWEIAVYLLNPARLSDAASSLRFTFSLLIGFLLLAITAGAWLIVRELRRELALARQKTDFVSNVSHELKTPLTSIRMFSELLAEGRVTDPEKQQSYLKIITAETGRLSRLINNVLDFSRMERGEKKYDFQPFDFAGLARETCANYQPHLETAGFRFHCQVPEGPLRVHGDRDALSQVIVNLLSNAEKYSGDRKDITMELRQLDSPLPHVELAVRDRGIGVPRGSETKIFEQFYRAHDSLASGIQGSGLGLTLARQIARAHGGDIAYESRDGGGSSFALRLPLPANTHTQT